MSLPEFLTRSRRSQKHLSRLDQTMHEYRPLLGSWLIKIALMLNWYQPEHDRWPTLFLDDDFLAATGLASREEPRRSRQPITASRCRKLLTDQLEVLEQENLSPQLPLFTNLKLLTDLLQLKEADQALLVFAALFELFPVYYSAICSRLAKTSNQSLWRILSGITDIPEDHFQRSTGTDGILATTGLVSIDPKIVDLESKCDIMKGLGGLLLLPHADAQELMGRFLRRMASPSLTLEHFPHLAPDSTALASYLENALREETSGVNVLLAGKPGVGKTEYAQALAVALRADLYEIAYAGPDGEPIKGESRLRAYALCQRLLGRSRNCLLLFDEVEDVFPSDLGLLSILFGDKEQGTQVAGKAWINRTMEQNPVPAIWISNQTEQIDHAYRRRFDYSILFPVPPKKVRLSIADHHLGPLDPPKEWLETIAGIEEITPAQLERAAKVARIAAGKNKRRARQLAEQTLQRSMSLLDQRRAPVRNRVRTGYDLAWLNVDTDLSRLIDGLGRRPHGTFCFYGAAGTGKSELARHIADQIGLPILVRRASDLLDKYVGESEKRIAAMFDAARQQNALLVLDEADSFLADRRGAHRSWEVTQVNELLTQMEAFDGIFICTTNYMEHLDQASLRRFVFKIRFDPLLPDQRWSLFQQEFRRLGGTTADVTEWEGRVRGLDGLTPGDFAVAARQVELWATSVAPATLFELLAGECRLKAGAKAKIGF